MTIWRVSAILWALTGILAGLGVLRRRGEFGFAWLACAMITGACAILATFIAAIVLTGVKF